MRVHRSLIRRVLRPVNAGSTGNDAAPGNCTVGRRNHESHQLPSATVRTVASIDELPGALTPGGEPVLVPLTVRNTGDIVQAYDIEVLGVPQRFATVEPPTLSLYPGTSGTATIALVVPRSADVPAGDYPLGVKVTPTGTPDEPVIQETSVRVLPFLETTAELIPRTTRGRRGAVHDLAIDNRGNVPIRCVIAGEDANQALRFDPRPQVVEIAPGEARFAAVGVKPVQRFWRGPARTHPFAVSVSPDDAPPVLLDGTHLQEPRLPKWFFKALAALLALLLVLAALWLLLLRPTIESAAKDAVAEDVAAAQDAAEEAAGAAVDAGQAANGAEQAATSAGKSAEEASTIVGGDEVGRVAPQSTRLSVRVAEGSTGTDTFTVPEDGTYGVTDVVFENPQGDSGTLDLLVDGDEFLTLALENFRSLDYHFVTPIRARSGQDITLRVTCRAVGEPPGVDPAPNRCLISSYVGGELLTTQ